MSERSRTVSFSDILSDELSGIYGRQTLREMGEIIRLYDFYEGRGQNWKTADGLDYKPSKLITNLCKKLIKRESCFMFGRTPEIRVLDREGTVIPELQDIIDRTLADCAFSERLLKGLRDCLIGRRVAIKLCGGAGRPLSVQFRPSLEFVYETEEGNVDRLSKIIFFYSTNDRADPGERRLWRQKYEMRGGRCFVTEGIYNGRGDLIEGGASHNTGLDFIPCRVILNDGLTGDLRGESDVEEIMAGQMTYNRLKSDDLDALRFNMFPQRVAIDADGASLENMVIAPGSLIDLMTDPARGDDGRSASLDTLEPKFSYDGRFEHAINRVKQDMFDILGVPNVSPDQLRGIAQSGRTLRALYWELEERCEERWTVWEPALRWMCRSLLKMEQVYYGIPVLPEKDYRIAVEHLYPIFEDEEAERELDLREVEAGVRSVESYRQKWLS